MTITIPPVRQGRPADPDLADRRGQMQAAVDAGAWKTAKPPLETTLAGLRCLRFKPDGKPRGYVLQLHGGGFRIGRPEFESLFAEALVNRCGVEVVVPQYRLAPEGPFPAGLSDAHAALTALRAEVGDAPLIVCGDSAGGGLAAALGVLCGEQIDALVLLSPWLDLRVSAPSYASFSFPPVRQGRPADPDLADRRGQMQAAVDAGAWKTAKPPLETTLAGLRCLRFKPDGKPKGYVLQLHGGGFRIGRPEFESLFAEALVNRCGVEVVVPQYRLAPEGPFPAGLSDAHAALTALRAEVGDAPLFVCGDSAGGGLAAALGVFCGEQIDALVLLSPWLDLRVSAPSYAANAATDPMFSKESADIAAELYLQGFEPTHPLASPLLAPITAYPPTLISVGTGETLADDSLRFQEKLLAAGADSRLSAIDGMEHVAVVRGLELPGSAETFAAIAAFVEELLP